MFPFIFKEQMKVDHIQVVKLVLHVIVFRTIAHRGLIPHNEGNSGVEPDNVSFISKDTTTFKDLVPPRRLERPHLIKAPGPKPGVSTIPPRRHIGDGDGSRTHIASVLQTAAWTNSATPSNFLKNYKTKNPDSSCEEPGFSVISIFIDFTNSAPQ